MTVVPLRSDRFSSNLFGLIQHRQWEDIIQALSNGASPHILVLPDMTLFEAYLRHLAKPELFKVPPHEDEEHLQERVFRALVNSWRENNPQHSTPLTLATMMGRPDLVQILLDAGHDPNEIGAGHQPATILASPLEFDNPMKIMKDLRQHPELGWSHEVRPGQQSCLRLLMRAGLDIEAKTWHSFNALQLACLAKNSAVVIDLLNAGADPEAGNASSVVSPLEISISNQSEHALVALLNGGANPLRAWVQQPHTGLPLASVACAQGLTSQVFAISKVLGGIEHPAMVQGWFLALNCANSRNVEWFIDKGQDISVRDENGYSALHHAALGGSVRIIEKLTSLGMDLSDPTPDGETARDLLSRHHPVSARSILGKMVGEPGNVLPWPRKAAMR